jgi:hypothetical protein
MPAVPVISFCATVVRRVRFIPMSTRSFMLDTSAINCIHDGLGCEWSLRGQLYVTDIQLQEIAQTRDLKRRDSLLLAFFSLRPTIIRPIGRVFVPEFFGSRSIAMPGFHCLRTITHGPSEAICHTLQRRSGPILRSSFGMR